PGAGPGAAGGGRPQMTPEMQEKLKELTGGKEMSELSQEERREVFQKMREQMGAGGPAGGVGGAPLVAGFTLEQRKAAVLPSPPERGSDVDVLLRPGLLADAEIIVQEVKDVVYIPYQALFESPQG